MPVQTVIIKKYENRRLYDTSNSRYVNLEEIAQMVRAGTEVQVIDSASGEDLTRQVLTQIIAENAKVSDSAFPVDMLREMVIASGRMSTDGLLGYMKAMSEIYQNTFRAFAAGPSPFNFTSREPDAAPATAPAKSAHPSVEELRRRVEDLERTIEKKSATKGATRSKRAARRKPQK